MSDKISKALAGLAAREREVVKGVIKKLLSGHIAGLDIRKLKGREDIFRIRKGSVRIIYRLYKKDVFILFIERGNDKTYKL